MTDDRRLGIYLNDHLAGAVAAIELARRCRANNLRDPLGLFLGTLVEELESARRGLEGMMEVLAVRKDPVKMAVGWAAEKLGRLKPNGQVAGYSPLSRLEEVEALCIAVEAQGSLWRGLKALAETDERLASVDLDALERQARGQRERLERHRIEAALAAFRP